MIKRLLLVLMSISSLCPDTFYTFYNGKIKYIEAKDRFDRETRKAKVGRPHKLFGKGSYYRDATLRQTFNPKNQDR